jgi:hypothetical protein
MGYSYRSAILNGRGEEAASFVNKATIQYCADMKHLALRGSEEAVRGQPAPFQFLFSKEEGAWKLDLKSFMPLVDTAFKALIQKQGLDEDTFLLGLAESVSGRKVPTTIWQPMIQ